MMCNILLMFNYFCYVNRFPQKKILQQMTLSIVLVISYTAVDCLHDKNSFSFHLYRIPLFSNTFHEICINSVSKMCNIQLMFNYFYCYVNCFPQTKFCNKLLILTKHRQISLIGWITYDEN